MTEIPKDIQKRLIHFQEAVEKHFSFLAGYGYNLRKIESGRTKNFHYYFCHFEFNNGDTSIRVNFSTDIIKGHTIGFPKLEQRPIVDNQISCFVSNAKARMGVSCLAETKYPEWSPDNFTIDLSSKTAKSEITRVVQNYTTFFHDKLVGVLKKEKMYNCYTDRFNDKIFEEIIYANK
jgi:hypothetical protein